MRFIMTCMVIVGLCLMALPLIPLFNGVQQERAQILANAAPDGMIAVPPPIAGDAAMVAFDAEAAALSGIEPAAGDVFIAPDEFSGGFTHQAPPALASDSNTLFTDTGAPQETD